MKQQSSVISPVSDCVDGADDLTAMELLPDLKSCSYCNRKSQVEATGASLLA